MVDTNINLGASTSLGRPPTPEEAGIIKANVNIDITLNADPRVGDGLAAHINTTGVWDDLSSPTILQQFKKAGPLSTDWVRIMSEAEIILYVQNNTAAIQLNVTDPSASTGVEAQVGTIGLDDAAVPILWYKYGAADTEWRESGQIPQTTSDAIQAILDADTDITLPDASGTVLANNVIAQVNNIMVKGDGLTVGGVKVNNSTPSPNTLTLISDSNNDVKGYGLIAIPDDWAVTSGITTHLGVSLGQGITIIGENAFNNCFGLTGSLTIPDSVSTIGENAFMDCAGFTGSLTIPDSVTTIGSGAFKRCDGFTGSLTLPDSITTLSSGMFTDCTSFTGSLTIPSLVTVIGNNTFYGCSNFIGTLTIPSLVTSIGSGAFEGNSGFTGSLIIPSLVTYIGNAAFRSCSNIDTMYINSVNASAWNSSAGYKSLGNTHALDNGNIYVTADVLSTYDSAWTTLNGTTATVSEWTSYPDPMT
jgi:hypothetical protein